VHDLGSANRQLGRCLTLVVQSNFSRDSNVSLGISEVPIGPVRSHFYLGSGFARCYTVPAASTDPYTEISGAPVIPIEAITSATLGFPSKKL
jgi:hypothetical protein